MSRTMQDDLSAPPASKAVIEPLPSQPEQPFSKKGDKGEEMYVLKEGEVDIVIDGLHFETVLPDGIFGELSLIDQETRIASPIARTDCIVQPIDKRHFLFLVQETPLFAIQVMKVMANRLRRVDLIIAKKSPEP